MSFVLSLTRFSFAASSTLGRMENKNQNGNLVRWLAALSIIELSDNGNGVKFIHSQEEFYISFKLTTNSYK